MARGRHGRRGPQLDTAHRIFTTLPVVPVKERTDRK